MNIYISSSDRDNQIFDSLYALPYIAFIKNKYPDYKINFGVPVQLYSFFSKFKIIDKVLLNIFQCNKPSYIDYPIQFIGKFKGGQIFNKSYYYQPEENMGINPFETVPDFFVEKRINKILNMVKYTEKQKTALVNITKAPDSYCKFILSFRPVIEPHMQNGACVISMWDLFNLVGKFDNYVGDVKTGQFFSTLTNSKKILIGDGDDINGDELYYRFTRKNLNIEKYDVKYLNGLDFDIDKIMGTLYV